MLYMVVTYIRMYERNSICMEKKRKPEKSPNRTKGSNEKLGTSPRTGP